MKKAHLPAAVAEKTSFPQIDERFRSLVESIEGVVWEATVDPLLFTYISPKLQSIFGFNPAEWNGTITPWIEAIHPEDREEALRYCATETAANRDHSFHYRLITPERGPVWVQDIVTITRTNGLPTGLRGIIMDITERKDIEYELLRQHRFYLTLAEGVGGIIWEIDFATQEFTYMSPQLTTFLGIEPSAWLGPIEKWLAAIHPEDRQKTFEFCMGEVLAGRDFAWEYRVVTPARGIVWLRAIGSVIMKNGQPVTVRGVTVDITAQRTEQQALQASNRQLRKLSLHLERVREEERQQISRQIHDDLGQSLTALNFDLAWLKKRTTDPAMQDRLSDMADQIRQATQTVQRVCTELRPSLLDDLGLEAALEWHLTEFSRRTGIKVTTTTNGFTCCDGPRSAHIFRIIQEALTNIIRHAAATEVTIFCGVKAHHFCLEITDNGCGISPQASRKKNAFGLLGIRERASLLGGTARISRRRAGGTLVKVSVPCSKNPGRPPVKEPACIS